MTRANGGERDKVGLEYFVRGKINPKLQLAGNLRRYE